MGFNFQGTKRSATLQLALGFLCIIFGIFDRIFIYMPNNWRTFHTEGVIAIWMGVWFVITGVIGTFASKPQPHNQQPKAPLINSYLGFSIVATVFAGVLLICYSVGLSYITGGRSCSGNKVYDHSCQYYGCLMTSRNMEKECRTSVGLGAMIIIFAIAEFVVSIWASACCCSNSCNGCCDTSPQQQGQVVYIQTQGGPVAAYVMTQGPNGMPMAVPALTGGAVQTQAVGGQTYTMQNPQAATTLAPPKYIQGAGGQVHVQNPQGAPAAIPLQQGVTTTSGDQQAGVNTDVPSEPPPVYTP